MKREKIFPKVHEYSVIGFFNSIAKVDHPFLQSLVDMKAIVYCEKDGYTMIGKETFVYLWLHPDNVVTLECIATPADSRKQGSGTMVMKALCAAADQTGTTIVLRATNVEMPTMRLGAIPFAIAHGATKKGKIPTKNLPKWYKKFGFEVTHVVRKKGNPENGVNMQRKPLEVSK